MTSTSHLRPDGTTSPPVTPDPPTPPGYEEPVLLDSGPLDQPEEGGSADQPEEGGSADQPEKGANPDDPPD